MMSSFNLRTRSSDASGRSSAAGVIRSLHAAAAAIALAFGTLSANAADAPAPVWRTDATATVSQSFDLIRLVPGGLATAVKLTGANPTQYFDFGIRADEVVSQATLELAFTPSPSLIPGTSQLNVYLNGELQGVQAITKEMLGKSAQISVPLNAKSMKTRNQLSLEFVGHYQIVCENEGNSSLWLDISPSSRLTLQKQNLRLPNDLAQLPTPFADVSFDGPTTLPVVFAESPSTDALRAAAIVTGRVAAVSAWRGSNFPVYFSEAPAKGHFVVFATNDKRPAFLASLPAFEGPELTIVDAPGSLYEKMLVVGGKTDADLVVAAQAFATPNRVLIGPHALIKDFKVAEPLPAYASPNWVNTDFAVPLSQLIEYPEQLTARGESLPPLHVNFRLAPDTYLTSASTATLSLLYRHSKPVSGQAAQLRTLVNGALADSQNLSVDASRGSAIVELPMTEGPAVALGGTRAGLAAFNDLSFEASYQAVAYEGSPENCRAATMPSHQIQIEPSSMIEFDGMFHYAQLPEIGLFTQGAFPFSKYADLSQTAAVVRDGARPIELTTMLNAVGRIAATTGVAPYHITVATQAESAKLKDKDLLIVGPMPKGILDISPESAAALADDVSKWFAAPAADAGKKPAADAASEEALLDTGFAAIVSVRSPLDDGRTAVAFFAEDGASGHLLNTRLSNPGDLATATGGTVFVGEDNIRSFAPGSTYTVGDMPWFRRVWLSLADRPFVLVFCALLAAIVAGAGIFLFMRRWIRRRGMPGTN